MAIPKFMIAGERRSGTTFLYSLLQHQKPLQLHSNPDFSYFLDRQIAGRRTWLDGRVSLEAWDSEHDRSAFEAEFKPDSGIHGFKDADFLYWHHAHPRAQRYMPDAKYLIVLRDPVERAWSHYWNEVLKGREDLSFKDAVQAESQRMDASDYARLHLSYVARGLYSVSLAKLLQTIPRERIYCTSLEHLKRDTRSELMEIFRFLELDEVPCLPVGVERNENTTTIPRSFATLPVVGTAVDFYTRAVDRCIRAATTNPYSRKRWRKTLNWPFRKPSVSETMDADLRGLLEHEYRDEPERLASQFGIEVPWKWA